MFALISPEVVIWFKKYEHLMVMGNCWYCLMSWCCCDWSQEDVNTKSRRPLKTLPSSPSQLDLKDMTTVHKISKINRKSVDKLLSRHGYNLGEEIGSGSNAMVYKTYVTHKHKKLADKQVVACKMVDISGKKYFSRCEADVKNELFVLERIQHHNVVQMYEHFIVHKHKLFIFMEYAKGGDLSGHLDLYGPFDENQCRMWFTQILNGVHHLHLKKIAHRDLKLQNILLREDKTAMISDFGLSRVSYRSERPGRKGGVQWSRDYCGTYPYMSPEILQNIDKYIYYNPFAADVWALGIILFLMFNKEYPFDPKLDKRTVITKMTQKTFKWSPTRKPSKQLKNCMKRIFEADPDIRINTNQLLTHVWVTNESKLDDISITETIEPQKSIH